MGYRTSLKTLTSKLKSFALSKAGTVKVHDPDPPTRFLSFNDSGVNASEKIEGSSARMKWNLTCGFLFVEFIISTSLPKNLGEIEDAPTLIESGNVYREKSMR